MSTLLKGILLTTTILGAATPAAQASVFDNYTRWPLTPNGYAVIPVCIIDGSSTQQKGDDGDAGLIHDTNPSLDAVLYRVKVAVAESWARHSSVRFIGWKDCEDLTEDERDDTVGLYIHKEAPNQSKLGKAARGNTSADDPGLQFKPWGSKFNRCIGYNWSTSTSSTATTASSSTRSMSSATRLGSSTSGSIRAHPRSARTSKMKLSPRRTRPSTISPSVTRS